MGGSKVECFVKEILANGRIEFFDIKANEVRVLFSLSGVKPVDYRCSVFPLVKVAFTGDGIVDAIKDCFAYFNNIYIYIIFAFSRRKGRDGREASGATKHN